MRGGHELAVDRRRRAASSRVVGEDEVAVLDGAVAVVAACSRPVGERLAVVELRVTPATGRGVFLRVLDHELDAVLGRPGHERLGLPKILLFSSDGRYAQAIREMIVPSGNEPSGNEPRPSR